MIIIGREVTIEVGGAILGGALDMGANGRVAEKNGMCG